MISKFQIILKEVSEQYGVSCADLLSESRIREHTFPRFVVMWFCRVHTTMTFPEIGRALNRDHTSVINGVQRITGYLEDAEFADLLDALSEHVAKKISATENILPQRPNPYVNHQANAMDAGVTY
jgi:chromosomal replication initiation ATPase DnaA